MAIIFKAIANASPKLLILNQDYFSNYCFFWSNLNKIKITIISLTEMIELLTLIICPNLVFDEKRLMLAKLNGCVTWSMCFLDHHLWVFVSDFTEEQNEGFFVPPLHPWAGPERPILNRVIIKSIFTGDYTVSILIDNLRFPEVPFS